MNMRNDMRIKNLQESKVAGDVMLELKEAELNMVSGAAGSTKKSSGDVCTITSECDHLRTLICC